MKIQPRIIPVLLLKNNGLYKTTKFKDPKYIGDPINAIKIFNEKEVDEIVFLDIIASREGKQPNFEMLKDIASECFMPLCYGGGVKDVEMIREILNIGVEKVSINSQAVRDPSLINKAANFFGSSTIVVSIDVKKNFFGKYEVFINDGQEKTALNPLDWAKEVERRGAGELMINSIDKDGTMSGYDFNLIKSISSEVNIPVIAAGGASSTNDFVKIVKESHASAAAAGAFFVFQGKHRAVLITYPNQKELKLIFQK
jgi:cyclase